MFGYHYFFTSDTYMGLFSRLQGPVSSSWTSSRLRFKDFKIEDSRLTKVQDRGYEFKTSSLRVTKVQNRGFKLNT